MWWVWQNQSNILEYNILSAFNENTLIEHSQNKILNSNVLKSFYFLLLILIGPYSAAFSD